MNNPFKKSAYRLSAAMLHQLPPDTGIEVAFAGRSNAGKSSAINAITQQKHLARTSKTPGRTQTINVFDIDEQHRLIDLPGYGYAKVPQATQKQWEETLSDYLQSRECLKGLILIIDIRHPLKSLDEHLLQWSESAMLPIHILLTKADKLKFGAAKNTLLSVQKSINIYKNPTSIQLFSATAQTGIEEARKKLIEWFEL